MVKVGFIIGSTRENSLSQRVAKAIASLLPAEYESEYLMLGHLPLYNQDQDLKDEIPKEHLEFREAVMALDSIIFVTPEHNRSMPAALKNALDIGSRSVRENIWAKKPALIVSQSPGAISGFGANHHLRQTLTFVDMPVVQQPEVYITNTPALFGEEGEILVDGTKDFLQSAVDAFVDLNKRYE